MSSRKFYTYDTSDNIKALCYVLGDEVYNPTFNKGEVIYFIYNGFDYKAEVLGIVNYRPGPGGGYVLKCIETNNPQMKVGYIWDSFSIEDIDSDVVVTTL